MILHALKNLCQHTSCASPSKCFNRLYRGMNHLEGEAHDVCWQRFLALISINLGIINLLPLPVLDGGHLLYYLIELLTGKEVPEKTQEAGFKIGALALLMLMAIGLFNDFSRVLG